MLKQTKDCIVNTVAKGAFLKNNFKFFGTTPVIFLIMWVYNKAYSKYTFSQIVNTTIAALTSTFLVYAFILEPHNAVLCMSNETADYIIDGTRCILWSISPFMWIYKVLEFLCVDLCLLQCITPIAKHWTSLVLYLLAEVWATLVIQNLFWIYINITSDKLEVKKYFKYYAFAGAISGAASGIFNMYFVSYGSGDMSGGQLARFAAKNVFLASIVIIGLHYMSTLLDVQISKIKNIIRSSSALKEQATGINSTPKDKKLASKETSLSDRIKFCFQRKITRNILLIVFFCGVSFTIMDTMAANELGKALNFVPSATFYWNNMVTVLLSVISLFFNAFRCFRIEVSEDAKKTTKGTIYDEHYSSEIKATSVALISLGSLCFLMLYEGNRMAGTLYYIWNSLGFKYNDSMINPQYPTPESCVVGYTLATMFMLCNAICRQYKYFAFDVGKEKSYMYLMPDKKDQMLSKNVIDTSAARLGKTANSAIMMVCVPLSALIGRCFGNDIATVVHREKWQEAWDCRYLIGTIFVLSAIIQCYTAWDLSKMYDDAIKAKQDAPDLIDTIDLEDTVNINANVKNNKKD